MKDLHGNLACATPRPPIASLLFAAPTFATDRDIAYDGTTQAAILSHGRITVFAKDRIYDKLMLCIKDWITQVSSRHRDRFAQPKNVVFG